MIPTVVVAPTLEPVSLAEAKLWCRVEGTEDDALLTGLITAAREFCEWKKGYAFYEQTLQVSFHGWPIGSNRIDLPRATPLRSIVSVTYFDSSSVSQTVSGANYSIDSNSLPGAITFAEDYSLPQIDVYAPNAISITYVAGQANQSPISPFPEAIKVAMRLLIEHWYRNREAVIVGGTAAVAGSELPIGVEALLNVNQALWAY